MSKKNLINGSLTKIIAPLVMIALMVIAVYFAWSWQLGQEPATQSVHFSGVQKITETSKLAMAFPEKMDRESVLKSIETSHELDGEVTWEGSTMVFEPEKRLETGETVTFRVGREAQYASGKPLIKPLEFKFIVAGPPVLSSHFPQDEAEGIQPDSKIHLVFDRPIIPLSAAQGTGSAKYDGQWPVTLDPPVRGQWRWLGTTTAEFTPAEGLEPGTNYKVSVPKGIKSVVGDRTEEDFSFTFQTIRPRVLSTLPSRGSNLNGPETEVRLTFNQEISPQAASREIRFSQLVTQPDEQGENEEAVDFTAEHAKNEETGETDRKTLVLIPRHPLPLDSQFTVVVPEGMTGRRGELGLAQEYQLSFRTAEALKVVETDYRNERYIFIKFNNPMNDDSLDGNITISPEVEGWDELEFTTNPWSDNRELVLYPNLEPSTKYTLRIASEAKDRFGQNLESVSTYAFTTPKTDPRVNILSQGEFGIFEKTKPPVYPFEAVNVSEINIQFARLPFSDFMDIRQSKQNNHDYKPNLQDFLSYQTFTLSPENQLNEWETLYLELEEELGRELSSGIYALRVEAPEYEREFYDGRKEKVIQYQYFSLTNHALTLKYSGKKALAWLVDMQSGAPVADADIRFYNLNGRSVISGATDEDGFFETDLNLSDFQTGSNTWNPEFWVTANKGNDFTFVGSQWNSGMLPWNFDLNDAFRGPEQQEYRMDSYLYTERQAYRPGDEVRFKGILRLRDKNGVVRLPDSADQVQVTIKDSKYNEIYQESLSVSAYGSFYDTITIDEEAPLGRFSIQARLLPEDDYDSNYSSHSFYVLEYRKPEFQVTVNPEEAHYFSGDEVEFTVTGEYFFGAPMSGADVSWHATMADYWFNRYTDGWYSFTLEDAWCWWGCEVSREEITEGEGELDENGSFSASFPLDINNKSTSQILAIEADVTDPNNQVVSNRAEVPMHKASIYVGVRTEDYAVSPGEAARIQVVTVDPEGDPIGKQRVNLNIFSREWNTVKKKNVDGYFYYENEPEDTFVKKTAVTTSENGKGIAEITLNEGGSYRIVAETADPSGREAKAGTSFYVFSQTYINWPHANNDRIEVIADKPEYKVGDRAKLLIKSPYQGEEVKALITVERENVIRKQVIPVESNAQPVEVEITEDMIPNAFVSAVVIKPRQGDTFDEEDGDTGMPAFKIGYVKLNVETIRKQLDVQVETDQERYGPGDTMVVSLQTRDFRGEPVPAELSLGVVDLSVQSLLGFRMPDLVNTFYRERGLGVRTAQMLTYLIEAFKPGSKGGGGGDADADARTDFKDTAYWNPAITTDEGGRAEVEVLLPDNLTTWQLLAIGQTKDHRYGADVKEVIETKKAIIRPVRPRFAVMGDEIDLGAIVHNFTTEEKTFQVSLTGEGFTARGDMTHEVTVASDQTATLTFPITAEKTDQLKLQFKAEAPAAADEIHESIPVYEFGTEQSVATFGWTDEQMMEQLYIPSEEEARRGSVHLTVSPTLASYLPDGLEYLVRFPYGCAEQTMSAYLPSLALRSLQGFEAFKIVDDKKLETIIQTGLQKLYTFQRGDGGFGYWSSSDRSYPYLTAYILYGLKRSEDAGYSVDAGVIRRANDYLNTELRKQDMEQRIDLATRAYILYVMAETGNRDINLIDNLYEQREALPLFAKAHLSLAYGSSNSKSAELLNDMMNRVKIDSRGAHFEEEDERLWRMTMNTNTRTTALVLRAMIAQDPDHDLIPRIVRYLLAVREEGRWDTTQSTTETIFTFIDFLKSTGELDADYTATASLAGEAILETDFDPGNVLTQQTAKVDFNELSRESYLNLILEKEGAGRMYYDLVLDYFLTLDTLPAIDQGLGIQRSIAPLNDGGEAFRVKGTYKTRLTITVPEDRHFVAVSSPLPAGFEPIDFTLEISQQRLQDEINQPDSEDGYYWRNPLWRFGHREFRDDQVFLFADYLPAGVYEYEYLVRATTPGKFRQRPARVWEMYFPETFGQSEGGWLQIGK
jgi:hypothetical protein